MLIRGIAGFMFAATLLLWPIAEAQGPVDVTPEPCATSLFMLDAGFSGAGMADCTVLDQDTISVSIVPEDRPINPSPWYSVRLTPMQSGPVTVRLAYDGYRHRYWPKTSTNGVDWDRVPERDIAISADEQEVAITLTLSDEPVFLSAQELITVEDYKVWHNAQASKPFVQTRQIGRSVDARPIQALETFAATQSAPTIVLVGRQHPPELSGAIAMFTFLETLLGDSDLATAFRARFSLLMVPLMNPDGVERGYWRHNLGGVDLNRDWGDFEHPETSALKAELDRIDTDFFQELALFLDFHSTRRNVFYTQAEGEDGTDYGFTRLWLASARDRLIRQGVAYQILREGDGFNGSEPTPGASKNYVHPRFGVPAIVYEVADEEDRTATRIAARVLAEEMMRVLMENTPVQDDN